mmetsp:Transcript_15914/g.42842  ORF Transcript_15914/g.42842 Transcript_15914/m.42842 type:complete len:205 (+) Transcript_15914:135-749(+)
MLDGRGEGRCSAIQDPRRIGILRAPPLRIRLDPAQPQSARHCQLWSKPWKRNLGPLLPARVGLRLAARAGVRPWPRERAGSATRRIAAIHAIGVQSRDDARVHYARLRGQVSESPDSLMAFFTLRSTVVFQASSFEIESYSYTTCVKPSTSKASNCVRMSLMSFASRVSAKEGSMPSYFSSLLRALSAAFSSADASSQSRARWK